MKMRLAECYFDAAKATGLNTFAKKSYLKFLLRSNTFILKDSTSK